MDIKKINPAVPKVTLLLIAGLVWMGTGIMLMSLAVSWLIKSPDSQIYLFAGPGILLGLPIHFFGFSKIVKTNIDRILEMSDRRCLFSFVPWKSYLIIIIMIAMGITLRHSAIPKKYLAIMYIGIGLALFLSSIRYLKIFTREKHAEQT
ncbi:MAG: hypothetical protein P8X42_11240 [Calditrichaceae bacterium]|jgi:hypothetical protein